MMQGLVSGLCAGKAHGRHFLHPTHRQPAEGRSGHSSSFAAHSHPATLSSGRAQHSYVCPAGRPQTQGNLMLSHLMTVCTTRRLLHILARSFAQKAFISRPRSVSENGSMQGVFVRHRYLLDFFAIWLD